MVLFMAPAGIVTAAGLHVQHAMPGMTRDLAIGRLGGFHRGPLATM